MPTPDEKLRAEQVAEYSVYVAAEAINIGTARAFNVGDPVPKSHVERGIVREDQVVKANTKAGEAAIAENPTQPPKEA